MKKMLLRIAATLAAVAGPVNAQTQRKAVMMGDRNRDGG